MPGICRREVRLMSRIYDPLSHLARFGVLMGVCIALATAQPSQRPILAQSRPGGSGAVSGVHTSPALRSAPPAAPGRGATPAAGKPDMGTVLWWPLCVAIIGGLIVIVLPALYTRMRNPVARATEKSYREALQV